MIGLRLPGVPLRIHLSFLLVALLGYGVFTGTEIVAWTLAVFFAVVLHEAGHAYTARAFGATSVEITLFALGGFTTYPANAVTAPLRKFVVSAAGSTVGIAAGGLVWYGARHGWFDGVNRLTEVFLESFFFASLVWGFLNWIPIRPLDGSAMLRSLLDAVVPARAAQIGWAVSLIAGIAAIAVAIRYGFYFAALFAALLTFSGLRDRPPGSTPAGDAGRVEDAGGTEDAVRRQMPHRRDDDRGPPERLGL